MPKPYTYPILFDNVKAFSITDLRKWGYLEPNQYKTGEISWSCRGIKTGSVSIAVYTATDEPYLELNYFFKSQPTTYRVSLVTVPSNLGKGELWYFLCPYTSKRCRILYSMGALFLHRNACKGYLYETQTYPRNNRKLFNALRKIFKREKEYSQFQKGHFKRTYAGKQTKKYRRLMNIPEL